MTKEQAKKLLSDNPNEDCLDFEGTCHDCKKPIIVSLVRGSEPEGFSVINGAIYQPAQEIFLKCFECFQKKQTLTKFSECEVYSRVVGYLRPIKQYNPGKQAEFRDRTMFRMKKI